MKTFGDRVRERRKELGLSQESLGKRAGISQTTVTQIERGRNASSTHILDVAKALGVSPEWLEKGRGDMLPASKHKTSTNDASITGHKTPMIREMLTEAGHTIGKSQVISGSANVLPLPRKIPVLSFEMAAQMSTQVDPFTLGEPLGTETIHQPFSLSTFAVPIVDASMEPRFERGHAVVIIDPARPPRPGSFVLARTRAGDAIFRKYRELGLDERGAPTFELVPMNDDFATLHSERDGLTVIGEMAAFTYYVDEWRPTAP
jgi:transcriptional regulator with XRE-family HTH domain